MSISLQNSLSWNALKALNARWALPVYPAFEDKKSNASDEKSHKKTTDRTNIIATNFVWEQLKSIKQYQMEHMCIKLIALRRRNAEQKSNKGKWKIKRL